MIARLVTLGLSLMLASCMHAIRTEYPPSWPPLGTGVGGCEQLSGRYLNKPAATRPLNIDLPGDPVRLLHFLTLEERPEEADLPEPQIVEMKVDREGLVTMVGLPDGFGNAPLKFRCTRSGLEYTDTASDSGEVYIGFIRGRLLLQRADDSSLIARISVVDRGLMWPAIPYRYEVVAWLRFLPAEDSGAGGL